LILSAPAGYHASTAIRDLATGHPFLQERVPKLRSLLEMRGYPTMVIEVYRYNIRQQYLFGGGRTGIDCIRRGVPSEFARPNDKVVTDAWLSLTSAHGYTISDSTGRIVPAAAAIDIVPVGADGKPFTADDQWADFLGKLEADANACGLRHFRNAHHEITDPPHLQLVEWDDAIRSLVERPAPPPTAA
jgi:hypothetical protein